ncbi:hypothetical protein IJ750_06300 [bacterium]|nr:hypothetical protein [bacterium]
MQIQPINNLSFKYYLTQAEAKEELKKRGATICTGMLFGTAGGLLYLGLIKKHKGSKLWIPTLECGAALAFLMDITRMIINMPSDIKRNKIEKTDITPFKDKNVFLSLYSGEIVQGYNKDDINKYNKLLLDKDFCNYLFKNKAVLNASQEALIEINNKKISEAKKSNDYKTVKTLEAVNEMLEKSKNNDKKQEQSFGCKQNVSFRSIFNFFTDGSETMKQRAEITVNRYAASAATTAGLLANTVVGDTAALTLITKNMCKKIFRIYDCDGGYTAAISAVAVGAVAGTNLATKGATLFPGAGNALNATITYSLHQLEGRALIEFLEENHNNLSSMSEVDAVSSFGYRLKQGLDFIDNETVKKYLDKAIDKALDIVL